MPNEYDYEREVNEIDEEMRQREREWKRMQEKVNKITSLLNELDIDFSVTKWENLEGTVIIISGTKIAFHVSLAGRTNIEYDDDFEGGAKNE